MIDNKFFNKYISRLKQNNFLLPLIILISILVIIIWASVFEIRSIVLMQGVISSEDSNKIISHQERGIIRDILIKEGDYVKEEQSLIIIENTQATEEKQKAEDKKNILLARISRLNAEIDGDLSFPNKNYQDINYKREAQTFNINMSVLDSKIENLNEKINSIKESNKSLEEQKLLLALEIDLLTESLESAQKLSDLGAGSQKIVRDKNIELVRTRLRLNEIEENINKNITTIESLNIEKNYERSNYLKRAKEILDELEAELSSVNVDINIALNQETRSKIKSPVNGRVHKIWNNTIGSSTRPADPLIEIIPDVSNLHIRARLDVSKRDLIWTGMDARIIPVNKSKYILNPIIGKVKEISSDSFLDDATNLHYYKVIVEFDNLTKEENNLLHLGMIADIRALSGNHTVLEYLLRPILKGSNNIMREPLQ